MKIVNATRKSQYVVRRLRNIEKFTSLDTLKEHLTTQLGEDIMDIGYIEPGHGMKGKQVWLVEDDDLAEMYTRFKTKQEITLWCHVRKEDDGTSVTQKKQKSSRKRLFQTDVHDNAPESKRQTCAQKLKDVEEIVKSLKEKHGAMYSTEKLNIWAHMLHIGKHDSYEQPPNVPYFTRGTKKSSPQGSQTANDLPTPSDPMSPRKRLGLRTECIDQLNKWHSLLEKGAITQADYDKVQQTILKDIMQHS